MSVSLVLSLSSITSVLLLHYHSVDTSQNYDYMLAGAHMRAV